MPIPCKGKQKDLTIATINTLFDGVDATQRSFWSWMMLHASTFIGRKKYVQKEQQVRNGPHPVEQIIEKYQPQILFVNEVIHAPWGSETMRILDENKYLHKAVGYPSNKENPLARTTVVASKLSGKTITIPVRNRTGGGFCGLHIEKKNLLAIGVQGSAFYPKIRSQQIKDVWDFCKQEQKIDKGKHIIVAGDFNCNLANKDTKAPSRLSHYTLPSFPHPNLMKNLETLPSIPQKLIKHLFSLKNGPNSFDHILVSSNWSVSNFKQIITTSDHLGLVIMLNAKC